MAYDYEVLYTRIRVLRLRKKYWRQQDLAEAAGLSLGHISRIEAGKNRPHLRTVQRIASALGVRVEDLVKFPEVAYETEDVNA